MISLSKPTIIHPLFPIQNGQTALIGASGNGNIQIVDSLLKAGAQPDIQDKVRIALLCSKYKDLLGI